MKKLNAETVKRRRAEIQKRVSKAEDFMRDVVKQAKRETLELRARCPHNEKWVRYGGYEIPVHWECPICGETYYEASPPA